MHSFSYLQRQDSCLGSSHNFNQILPTQLLAVLSRYQIFFGTHGGWLQMAWHNQLIMSETAVAEKVTAFFESADNETGRELMALPR